MNISFHSYTSIKSFLCWTHSALWDRKWAPSLEWQSYSLHFFTWMLVLFSTKFQYSRKRRQDDEGKQSGEVGIQQLVLTFFLTMHCCLQRKERGLMPVLNLELITIAKISHLDSLWKTLRGTRKWSIGFNRMVDLYSSASYHWLYFDCFCRAWNQTIYVDLWDTEGDSEIHINKVLIEKGFAQETDHPVNNPWNMEGTVTQSHQKVVGLPGWMNSSLGCFSLRCYVAWNQKGLKIAWQL